MPEKCRNCESVVVRVDEQDLCVACAVQRRSILAVDPLLGVPLDEAMAAVNLMMNQRVDNLTRNAGCEPWKAGISAALNATYRDIMRHGQVTPFILGKGDA